MNWTPWIDFSQRLSRAFLPIQGRSEKFAATILEAFPDKQYTVEEIIGQGDKVLVRMTVKGTHQGMFFGTAPTGNTIDVTLYRQYRVEDGKIAEHRGWIDMVTMWSQIRGS